MCVTLETTEFKHLILLTEIFVSFPLLVVLIFVIIIHIYYSRGAKFTLAAN